MLYDDSNDNDDKDDNKGIDDHGGCGYDEENTFNLLFLSLAQVVGDIYQRCFLSTW